MKNMKWKTLLICFLIVFGTAFIGSLFTSSNTNSDWYQQTKPSITPPSYVFPIVWNLLFVMISLSLYFAWTRAKNKDKKKIALVFGINLFLNALWSLLFFGLRLPAFAFIEVIILWLSILSIILVSYKTSKLSAYLLIPYFLWVSFASYLNYLAAF